MKKEIKALLEKEAKAVLNIPLEDGFEKSVEMIYKYVHQKNGKVITSGMGKAGQIALNISTTLSSTGTPAAFIHPSEAQHGDLGLIQKNDILLVISNSGKTREILEFIHLAKGLYADLPVIVITGNPDSTLPQMADCTIFTGNPEEVCLLGLSPTTSTTVMTVIGDVLVVQLMKKINFTTKDYSLRHHGGYLGDKSRNESMNTKK